MKGIGEQKILRGFTMTEMMVLTSISAVAVAMILPSMNLARQEERTARGLANLQQIGQTIYVFAVENSNRLPYGYHRDAPPRAHPGGRETDWTILLNDFLAGGGATYAAVAGPPSYNTILPIFRDPNAVYASQGMYHYTAHPVLMPDSNEWSEEYAITRFRRPHEVFLVADAIQRPTGRIPRTSFATGFGVDQRSLAPNRTPFYHAGDSDNHAPIAPGVNSDDPDPRAAGAKNLADIRWRQRNNSAANFVFADGHCETLQQSEVKKRHIRADP